MPGVGDHVATVYLPILAEIERFPTAKHLVSYLGLSPITTESGTSIKGHRRISKMGNPYLRKTLYMPARSLCLRSRRYRDWFKRRCDEGKHPKQLYVIVMRKIVTYLYKVITTSFPHPALMPIEANQRAMIRLFCFELESRCYNALELIEQEKLTGAKKKAAIAEIRDSILYMLPLCN